MGGSQLLLKVDMELTTSIYKTLGPVCSVDRDLSSCDSIHKYSYTNYIRCAHLMHTALFESRNQACVSRHAHHFHRTILHARQVNAHSTLYFHAYRHINQNVCAGAYAYTHARVHTHNTHTHTHTQDNYTHLHTQTQHARTHENTHKHTHIHTHAQTLFI